MKKLLLISATIFSFFTHTMEINQEKILDHKKVCWFDFVKNLPAEIQHLIFNYFKNKESEWKVYITKDDKNFWIQKPFENGRITVEKVKTNTHNEILVRKDSKLVRRKQRIRDDYKLYCSQPNKKGAFVINRTLRDCGGAKIYCCPHFYSTVNLHPDTLLVISSNGEEIGLMDYEPEWPDILSRRVKFLNEKIKQKIVKNRITFVNFVHDKNSDDNQTLITFTLQEKYSEKIKCYLANLSTQKFRCIYAGLAAHGGKVDSLGYNFKHRTPYEVYRSLYDSLQEVALVADVSALVADKKTTQEEKDKFLQKFDALTVERRDALHRVTLNGKSIFKQLESKIS